MCNATGPTAKICGSILAAALLSCARVAFATGLTVNAVPASTAATLVDQAFGTKVDLGLGLNPNQRVSFNIPDTSVPGARLTAVNYLAHQLDAKRLTVLAVDKSNGAASKASAALDTTANVQFTSSTVPATAVLHQIAYVDDADLIYNTPLAENVTFSHTVLPALQAADEVAEQTHTTLAVSYKLISRTHPVTTVVGATIIGFTPGGQPILSDMVVTKPPQNRVYAHRTTSNQTVRQKTSPRTIRRSPSRRYPHRRSTGSISITSSQASTTAATTGTTAAATVPINATPPATLLLPRPPGLSYYNLNGAPVLAPIWPYNYATPWWPTSYPYGYGNGAFVVAPGGPLGPRVVVP